MLSQRFNGNTVAAPLAPVVTCIAPPGGGVNASNSATGESSYRVFQNQTGKRITSLALVYICAKNDTVTPLAEAAVGNGIQIKATVQKMDQDTMSNVAGPRFHFTKNQARAMLCSDLSWIQTDPLAIVIEPNEYFRVLTWVAPQSGAGNVPWVGWVGDEYDFWTSTNGEGYDSGADRASDNGTTPTILTTSNRYGPSIVLGTLADGSIPKSLCIMGDSIANGGNDQAGPLGAGGWSNAPRGGWVNRALPNTIRYSLAANGHRMQTAADPTKIQIANDLAQFATHVLIQLGRNDLANARTAVQLEGDLLTLVKRLTLQGKQVIACTTLAEVTSSDSWKTYTNQTPASWNAARVTYNQYLRNGTLASDIATYMSGLGITNYKAPRVLDVNVNWEYNSSGVLTTDGGRTPIDSGVIDSFTSGAGGATNKAQHTGAAWTVNDKRGYTLYDSSQAGNKVLTIMWNTADTVTLATTLGTSTVGHAVEIGNMPLSDGIHPETPGAKVIAAGISETAVMA